MKTIKVKKSDLVTHLTKNMANHILKYDLAMEEYRKALIAELKQKLKLAREGKRINHTLSVIKPESYVKSYQEAILQLEWNIDEEILLDSTEFQQYVNDNWSWKNLFNQTISGYIK